MNDIDKNDTLNNDGEILINIIGALIISSCTYVLGANYWQLTI